MSNIKLKNGQKGEIEIHPSTPFLKHSRAGAVSLVYGGIHTYKIITINCTPSEECLLDITYKLIYFNRPIYSDDWGLRCQWPPERRRNLWHFRRLKVLPGRSLNEDEAILPLLPHRTALGKEFQANWRPCCCSLCWRYRCWRWPHRHHGDLVLPELLGQPAGLPLADNQGKAETG